MQKELKEAKALMEDAVKRTQECYNLLEEYGIPIPGRTTQGHDARTFKWKITKVSDKIAEY